MHSRWGSTLAVPSSTQWVVTSHYGLLRSVVPPFSVTHSGWYHTGCGVHRRPASRGDLVAYLPECTVLLDAVITHPLASSALLRASAQGGATARAAEAAKRRKYARSGTGACVFIPLAHETYGRAGPAAWRFLRRLATAAAESGSVCRRTFLVHAMQRLSVTLCRVVARQVRTSDPLKARLVGKWVLAELAAPTHKFLPHVGFE